MGAVCGYRKKRVLRAVMRVDLNPVRAGISDTLADSKHTSVQRRLQAREKGSTQSSISLLNRPLKPVAGIDADGLLELTESSYIELVQWTGEQERPDKRGSLKPTTNKPLAAPAAVRQLSNHPDAWFRQVQGTESIYYRAIGSAEALMAKAEALGQAWMKGVASDVAKAILRQQPT